MTDKGRIETLSWLKFIITLCLVGAGVVACFARLEMGQDTLQSQMVEMKRGGTAVAVQNRERISVLESRLGNLEKGQQAANDKLDRLLQRP